MNWRTGVFSLLVWALAPLAGASSADQADTATLYLRAWNFKDYATMRDLTASPVLRSLDQSAYYGAAGHLPAPLTEPRILSRAPRSGAAPGTETIYFEYSAPESQAPVRGSIVVGPDGVLHPELIAVASRMAAPAAGAAGVTANTVEGESVDSILQKMQKATEAARTLQSDVAIRGSMLGTSVQETARLTYKAPNKLRLQARSFVMNTDGTRSVLYLPDSNIYMNLSELGDLELAPGIGMTAEELKEKYDITLAGKTEINGEPAFELKMKSPGSAGGLGLGVGQGSGRMTMWVSARSWLPIRASMDGMKVDYRNMRVNAGEIDDAVFDFKPPAGANAFSLGGLMGALGGSGLLPE